MEFVSSFSVARSASNVGKFRERVSNRFGTEDDDRGSLSPVSLATCKPNCVTWSGTETGRSWETRGAGGDIQRIRRPSAVGRRFNDPTCGYPFLRAHPVFDYTVADIARPVTRQAREEMPRIPPAGYPRILNVTDVHILSRSLASPLFANRTVTCARIRRVLYVTKSLANTQRRVDFPFRIVQNLDPMTRSGNKYREKLFVLIFLTFERRNIISIYDNRSFSLPELEYFRESLHVSLSSRSLLSSL